jgi:hypothetical protein
VDGDTADDGVACTRSSSNASGASIAITPVPPNRDTVSATTTPLGLRNDVASSVETANVTSVAPLDPVPRSGVTADGFGNRARLGAVETAGAGSGA